jgi:flagellar FliJ protein
MKRFRFPLRPVAVIRAHHESRAKDAYRAAFSVLNEAEQRHARSLARLRSLAEAIASHRQGSFSPQQAAATARAYSMESQEVARDEKSVSDARHAMLGAREAYIKAHRELKVVQRLEEKARASHLAVCRLLEQAALDELAVSARRPAVQLP